MPVHVRQQGVLHEVDCDYWLAVLYPKKRVLEQRSPVLNEIRSINGYHCNYNYGEGRSIDIKLENERFSVSVDFPTM